MIPALSTACFPQIANGTAALKALIGKLPSDFKCETGLVMADGDYVSIYGVISVIRSSYRWGYRPGEPIGSAASRRHTELPTTDAA